MVFFFFFLGLISTWHENPAALWLEQREAQCLRLRFGVRLDSLFFASLFYYSAYYLPVFMGSTALFGIIHGSHFTISANFYLYQ